MEILLDISSPFDNPPPPERHIPRYPVAPLHVPQPIPPQPNGAAPPAARAVTTPPPVQAAPAPERNPLACWVDGCHKFGKAFVSHFALDQHTEACHPQPKTATTPPPAPVQDAPSRAARPPVGKFGCTDCDYTAKARATIQWHCIKEHGTSCGKMTMDGKPLITIHSQNRRLTKDTANYECAKCGYLGLTSSAIRNHAARLHKTTAGLVTALKPGPKATAPKSTAPKSIARPYKRGSPALVTDPAQAVARCAKCAYLGASTKHVRVHAYTVHGSSKGCVIHLKPNPRRPTFKEEPDGEGGMLGQFYVSGPGSHLEGVRNLTMARALETAGKLLEMGFHKVEIGVQK